MSKIVSLGDHTQDASYENPQSILEKALTDLKDENCLFSRVDNILVLGVDKKDGQFSVYFKQNGMRMSECVALTETAKTIFLKEMGYLGE